MEANRLRTDTASHIDFENEHRRRISRELTKREVQVADLFYEGYSNKQIGRSLGISNRTVEVHRANIMLKVGVRNSTELVRLMAGDPKSD